MSDDADSIVKAGFAIAERMRRNKNLFLMGVCQGCLLAAMEYVYPSKVYVLKKTSLSRNTITQKVVELLANVGETLKK